MKRSFYKRIDNNRVGFDYWPNGQISAKGALQPVAKVEQVAKDSDGTIASVVEIFKNLKSEREAKANNALTVATAEGQFQQTEAMLWDGLALLEKQSCGVSREACPGDAQSVAYTVEPHVSGGVPLLAQSSSAPAMLVSDFLGTTLGVVRGETFVPSPMSAFGECASSIERPASSSSSFFTGKAWDADLQAYNFLFRNYQPKMARWTAVDPSGFPDGANQWMYCCNTATTSLDAYGLTSAPGPLPRDVAGVPGNDELGEYFGPVDYGYQWRADPHSCGQGSRATVTSVNTTLVSDIVIYVDNPNYQSEYRPKVVNHEWEHYDIAKTAYSIIFGRFESLLAGVTTDYWKTQNEATAALGRVVENLFTQAQSALSRVINPYDTSVAHNSIPGTYGLPGTTGRWPIDWGKLTADANAAAQQLKLMPPEKGNHVCPE